MLSVAFEVLCGIDINFGPRYFIFKISFWPCVGSFNILVNSYGVSWVLWHFVGLRIIFGFVVRVSGLWCL